MKNIHVLPTSQASRLVKSKFSDTLLLANMASKRAEWKNVKKERLQASFFIFKK